MGSKKKPIAIIFYNRPNHLRSVLESVMDAHNAVFYLISDGPKKNIEDEKKIRMARECCDSVLKYREVVKIYSDVNMGVGRRVVSGLNEVFSREEECIVLEDDCVPDPSFLRMCSTLLERYRHDERIGLISGTNEIGEYDPTAPGSYFYSYGMIWGWATWRRAWEKNDYELSSFSSESLKAVRRNIGGYEPLYQEIVSGCRSALYGEVDTWDYQWLYSRCLHGMCDIVPRRNLVTNIGIGADATHTRVDANINVENPARSLDGELLFNDDVTVDLDYLRACYSRLQSSGTTESLRARLRRQVLRILRGRRFKSLKDFRGPHSS
jgi:hypothetical protein